MNVAAPEPKSNMGQPEPRTDGRLKVTGAARYAADVQLENVTHGVLVLSTVARGKIARIDTEAAEKAPLRLKLGIQRD